MRRISIFGSTGSIGENTVDLIERQGGREAYETVVVTGGANVALLAQHARALNAEFAVIASDALLDDLKDALDGCGTKALAGTDALVDAARAPVDWAMSAIVGAAGLAPTMELAQHADTLALANKESLVCAGDLLLAKCATHNTQLLPVDSEHSAIFQALTGHSSEDISRILLTASGGPFRTWSREEMFNATKAQALTHPNWNMGARITVDSASMFNKALEVIEAKYLFGVRPDQIDVVVHPQSIVHSAVEFSDGAVMAQLGSPDMRGPIGFALNHPKRQELPVERLDFTKLARLDFETPDIDRFPSLRLAQEALEIGGGAGAVLNAAKEVALDAFLEERIGFMQMADCVEATLNLLGSRAGSVTIRDGIDEIFLLNTEARDAATKWLMRSNTDKRAV